MLATPQSAKCRQVDGSGDQHSGAALKVCAGRSAACHEKKKKKHMKRGAPLGRESLVQNLF